MLFAFATFAVKVSGLVAPLAGKKKARIAGFALLRLGRFVVCLRPFDVDPVLLLAGLLPWPLLVVAH